MGGDTGTVPGKKAVTYRLMVGHVWSECIFTIETYGTLKPMTLSQESNAILRRLVNFPENFPGIYPGTSFLVDVLGWNAV